MALVKQWPRLTTDLCHFINNFTINFSRVIEYCLIKCWASKLLSVRNAREKNTCTSTFWFIKQKLPLATRLKSCKINIPIDYLHSMHGNGWRKMSQSTGAIQTRNPSGCIFWRTLFSRSTDVHISISLSCVVAENMPKLSYHTLPYACWPNWLNSFRLFIS